MKYLIFIILFFTQVSFAEPLKIMVIGESTSLGWNAGENHDEACIPLLVKQEIEKTGIPVILENRAVISTTVGWHVLNNPVSFLMESKSNIVIIQLGINDAVRVEPDQFVQDFSELIDNCKKSGKIVYINMPNNIEGILNYKLWYYAYLMEIIGTQKNVVIVNSGVQEVPLFDLYHPTTAGYIQLGEDLKHRLVKDAPNILAYIHAIKLSQALFNRTPDAEGANYWANVILMFGRDWATNYMLSFIGPKSDAEFIDMIYFNLIERTPDNAGKTYWLDRLTTYSSN